MIRTKLIHRTDMPGVIEIQWANGDRSYGRGWRFLVKSPLRRMWRRKRLWWVLVPLVVAVALAAPASAQAISSNQAADQAQLYFQNRIEPGTYNPSSYYWVCEERFFGWACTTFVRMYRSCQPPEFDGRLVVSVHMNHRGTGRRFSAWHCSRSA